jgi:hypothetical protein
MIQSEVYQYLEENVGLHITYTSGLCNLFEEILVFFVQQYLPPSKLDIFGGLLYGRAWQLRGLKWDVRM